MKIETSHTRPAPRQSDPDAETLPMPLAGGDLGPEPAQARGEPPGAQWPSGLHGMWDPLRAAAATLPLRAKKARAEGRRYVADEPLKAVAFAAAGGATLAVLLRAMARRNRG